MAKAPRIQVTSVPVPRIDINTLDLGKRLGSGGQGQVTAVNGYLVNGRWPAVVKTYLPATKHAIQVSALEAIVGFPQLLAPHDSHWLYENTAWPAVLVEDQGSACGFLMRAVPPACYFDFQTQTKGPERKPSDMAFLLNSDDYVRRAGITVSEQDRLALLGSLAAALSRLHALGTAVGDLSPKNVLFSLGSSPSCFLIDCDAVHLRGVTVLDQVETPDWEAPAGETRATQPPTLTSSVCSPFASSLVTSHLVMPPRWQQPHLSSAG